MCFATAALAASVIGGAVTAGGTLESGFATSKADNYAAEVAANNSAIAQANARYAEEAGVSAATTSSLKGASQIGKIKTGQAASGVDVNTGSAVDVQASQRGVNKLDTENVLANAGLTSYGYRSQAANYQAQSALDKAAASQAVTGAEIGAAGSFLSSAGGTSMKWSQANPGSTTGTAPTPTGTSDTTGYGVDG